MSRPMRALLVNPEFPDSYWSGRYALPFAGCKSASPPLALITVAALLPEHWECRLVDLAIEPLRDEDILWADVVMLTGMLVQRRSMHEILERCSRLGVRTAVGGPYPTALPDQLHMADHVVVGEGEELIPVLAADLEAGCAKHEYRETEKPSMADAPRPRFDLLKVDAYRSMAVQYSRGCPFRCEFCDIIVMYGRRPRVKTPAQVIAELEAIRLTGFAGPVFFVDDNFIGNKKAVKELLPQIAAWRRRTKAPLDFYTDASMNLADDLELVDLMTDAGFSAVFIGIETPSQEALRETKKFQNLDRDMAEQVGDLLGRGLEIRAGFILGFDNDGEDIFERMVEFIERAALPSAMIGVLAALPNTPLSARLAAEGRLRDTQPGDQFGLTNVMTKIPDLTMARGYRWVLQRLYEPNNYLARCLRNVARWRLVKGARRPLNLREVVAGARAMWTQGVLADYRLAYWRYVLSVALRHPRKLPYGLGIAALGHHFITYTRTAVVSSLEEVERALEATSASSVEPPKRELAAGAVHLHVLRDSDAVRDAAG
jgi:radical SAM superfamily enzyme YgiQ (UPF0313 family)